MSEKLKVCFCGGEVFIVDSKITPSGTVWVNLQCRMCGAVIHTSVDYWQSRPIEDALTKKLELARDAMIEVRSQISSLNHKAATILDDALAEIEKEK